jgi:hypothetical protein
MRFRYLAGAAALAFFFATVGCGGVMFAQVPPTAHAAQLSWTAPAPNAGWAGCVTGQPSCGYILSRIAVAANATSCPTPTLSGNVGNYTPLNQANPTTATTYGDTSAAGGTYCYIAQTTQGAAISNPSNTAGPVTVLGNPTSPTMGPATSAQNTLPAIGKPAEPTLAMALPAPELHLRVSSR